MQVYGGYILAHNRNTNKTTIKQVFCNACSLYEARKIFWDECLENFPPSSDWMSHECDAVLEQTGEINDSIY